MKPTKKEVEKAKSKANKVIEKQSNVRIRELEELVVLMDAKIISLENDMKSMQDIYDRIRKRMGL
tara:strand:- start:208 stop:402 length:195 start_codon:yes stop_codon:yes gene_type:complete